MSSPMKRVPLARKTRYQLRRAIAWLDRELAKKEPPTCWRCQGVVAADAETCPHCGAVLLPF